MSGRHSAGIGFGDACDLIGSLLEGSARRELVTRLSAARDFGSALRQLRECMVSGVWPLGARRIQLRPVLQAFDRVTRAEGFHVLHDWDGIADRVNDHTIAVDVLDYAARQRGTDPPDAAALAILVDYYFLYLLALLSMRVWDEDAADAHLDRVHDLLQRLQSGDGSGQPFAADAETLILIATSHYEMNEQGFDGLLDRVRALNAEHRLNVALGHAVCLGCHLRFGLEATYAGDCGAMRADNVADYPWLFFSIETLLDEYARCADANAYGDGDATARAPVAEALLNGLSADVRGCLSQTALGERIAAHASTLVHESERYRPSDDRYSPLSFFFNFSHNVLKGAVVDALMWGEPWPLTLNDMLTSGCATAAHGERQKKLATTLMGYARANPDRIRGRLTPVIVYDALAGRRAYAAAMRELRTSIEARS